MATKREKLSAEALQRATEAALTPTNAIVQNNIDFVLQRLDTMGGMIAAGISSTLCGVNNSLTIADGIKTFKSIDKSKSIFGKLEQLGKTFEDAQKSIKTVVEHIEQGTLVPNYTGLFSKLLENLAEYQEKNFKFFEDNAKAAHKVFLTEENINFILDQYTKKQKDANKDVASTQEVTLDKETIKDLNDTFSKLFKENNNKAELTVTGGLTTKDLTQLQDIFSSLKVKNLEKNGILSLFNIYKLLNNTVDEINTLDTTNASNAVDSLFNKQTGLLYKIINNIEEINNLSIDEQNTLDRVNKISEVLYTLADIKLDKPIKDKILWGYASLFVKDGAIDILTNGINKNGVSDISVNKANYIKQLLSILSSINVNTPLNENVLIQYASIFGVWEDNEHSFIDYIFDGINKSSITGSTNVLVGMMAEVLNTISSIKADNKIDIKNLINYEYLFIKGGPLDVLFDAINNFKINDKTKDKTNKILKIFEDLNKLNEIQKINPKVFDSYIKAFGGEPSKIKEVLDSVSSLDTKQLNQAKTKIDKLTPFLDSLAAIAAYKDQFKDVVTSLKELVKGINEMAELLKSAIKLNDEDIQSITDSLKKIRDLYEKDVKETAAAVKGGSGDVKSITDANEKNKKDLNAAGKTDPKEIQKSQMNFKGLASLVIAGAAVLIIGGLIMTKYPELIIGAAKFALVLIGFITLLMIPMALASKFGGDGLKNLDAIGNFVVKASLIMLVGALVVMLGGGKLVIAALKFAVVLALFEAMVILPTLMFGVLAKTKGDTINAVTNFIIKCAVVMVIGALVMMLGGGKLVQNAIKFAVVLAIFEAMVIFPTLMFGLIANASGDAIKGITNFIIKCSMIMIIGALVMMIGGGKFVKHAFMFAIALCFFEALVILPTIAFGLLIGATGDVIKSVTNFIIKCSMIMIIGALVMMLGGGKFVKHALLFGVVLMAFMILVLSPIVLFSRLGKPLEKSLIEVTAFVMVCSFIMILGAIFMMVQGGQLAWNALLFGVLLAAFIGLVLAPFKFFKNDIEKAVPTGSELAILIAVSAVAIVLGPVLLKKAGVLWYEVLGFAILLVGFIRFVLAAFKKYGPDAKGAIPTAKAISVVIGISALAVTLGPVLLKKAGVNRLEVLGFAGLLVTFVGGILFAYNKFAKSIKTALPTAQAIAIIIAASAGALVLGPTIMKLAGIEPEQIMEFALLLGGFIGAVLLVFRIFNKDITMAQQTGVALGVVIGASALALTLGPLIMKQFNIGYDDVMVFAATLGVFIGAVLLVFKLFGNDIKTTIEPAKSMAIIIGVSAVALTLGPTMMKLFGFSYGDVMTFAVTLAGFILAVVKIYKPIEGDIKKSIAPAAAMVLIMISSALTVALGGKIWRKYGMDAVFGAGVIVAVIGAMVVMLKILSNAQGDVIKGAAALAIVSGCGLILGVMMVLLGKAAQGDLLKILGAVGIMALIVAGLSGIALALGFASVTPPMSLFFWAGIGALAAVVGIALMASVAMLNIAKAMDILANVKPINPAVIVGNITAFASVGAALMPFITMAPYITAVSVAFTAMAKMVEKIADAVKHYASLKIPVYAGTKVVGYRELTKADFRNAATNVKKLIVILGSAIKQVYEENKDLFVGTGLFGGGQTIFDKVVRSCTGLGKMLSSIAAGVAQYAKLQIPIKWDKDGKAIEYKNMSSSDFVDASKNIKKVITTLSSAIVSVYDNDKNGMFTGTGWFGGGQSKFDKVVRSCTGLGKMIGDISAGLKSYASLRIPIKWDKEGKPIDYHQLDSTDFKAASDNIGLVISTLASAIISTYDAHPTWFAGTGWFGGGEPKFTKVMKSLGGIGKLIGDTASGLKNYVQLMIPTKWDKDGKAIEFEQLKDSDFESAAKNIGLVISTIANAIFDVVDKNPDLFDDGEDSEFAVACKAIGNMSNMVKTIADGITHMAKAQLPIYNDKGKITGYEKIDIAGVGTALSDTLGAIITAIGTTIFGIVNQNPDLFDDGEDSEFAVACQAIGNMSNMIKNIADGVVNMAKAQLPIYNDKGKITGYEKINIGEISKNLSNVVGTIIESIGKSVTDVVKNNKELFDDGEDSEFAVACQAIGNMSNMIKNIADAVVNMAKAQLPIYNDKGKITGYEKINIAEATTQLIKILGGEGESKPGIISAIGSAIVSAVSGDNAKYFDDGEDSVFAVACQSISNMGNFIKNVAEGITMLATGSTVEYDSKGKPKKSTSITSESIKLAQTVIIDIITAMSTALMQTVESNKTIFEGGENSPFAIACNSISQLGNLVSQISTSLKELSDGKKINPKTIETAKSAIIDIITAMSSAMSEVISGDNKDMFTTTQTSTGDQCPAPFVNAAEALATMGHLVSDIANGIQIFAVGAPKYNSKGQIVGYVKLQKSDIEIAKTAIKDIIIAIGAGIARAINEHPDYFKGGENSLIGQAASAIAEATSVISEVSRIIQAYAGISNDKEIVNIKETDIKKAKQMVAKAIISIPEAMNEKYKVMQQYTLYSNENALSNLENIFDDTRSLINQIDKLVKTVNDFKEYKNVDKKTIDIKSYITNIASIVNAISTGFSKDPEISNPLKIMESISSAYLIISSLSNALSSKKNGTPGMFEMINFIVQKYDETKVGEKVTSIETNVISDISRLVKAFNKIKDLVGDIKTDKSFIGKIFGKISGSNGSDKMKLESIENVCNVIISLFNSTSSIIENSNKIKTTLDTNPDLNKKTVQSAIDELNEIKDIIADAVMNKSSIILGRIKVNYFESISKLVVSLAKSLNTINVQSNKIARLINGTNIKNQHILQNGIDALNNVNNIGDNIKLTTKFKTNKNILYFNNVANSIKLLANALKLINEEASKMTKSVIMSKLHNDTIKSGVNAINDVNDIVNHIDLGRNKNDDGSDVKTKNNTNNIINIINEIRVLVVALSTIYKMTSKLSEYIDGDEFKNKALIHASIKAINDINDIINHINLGRNKNDDGSDVKTKNNDELLNVLNTSIKTLVNTLKEIHNSTNELSNYIEGDEFKNKALIHASVNAINDVNNIINHINLGRNANEATKDNKKDLDNIIKAITDLVNAVVEVSTLTDSLNKYISDNKIKGVDLLQSAVLSINEVNSIINSLDLGSMSGEKIDNTQNFEDINDSINKLVACIESINSQTDKLNGLVNNEQSNILPSLELGVETVSQVNNILNSLDLSNGTSDNSGHFENILNSVSQLSNCLEVINKESEKIGNYISGDQVNNQLLIENGVEALKNVNQVNKIDLGKIGSTNVNTQQFVNVAASISGLVKALNTINTETNKLLSDTQLNDNTKQLLNVTQSISGLVTCLVQVHEKTNKINDCLNGNQLKNQELVDKGIEAVNKLNNTIVNNLDFSEDSASVISKNINSINKLGSAVKALVKVLDLINTETKRLPKLIKDGQVNNQNLVEDSVKSINKINDILNDLEVNSEKSGKVSNVRHLNTISMTVSNLVRTLEKIDEDTKKINKYIKSGQINNQKEIEDSIKSINELNSAINKLELGKGNNQETTDNTKHFNNLSSCISVLVNCLQSINEETKKIDKYIKGGQINNKEQIVNAIDSLNDLNAAINTLDLGRGDNLETFNNKSHFDNIVNTISKLTSCLEEIKNETNKLHKSLTKDKVNIKTKELIENSIKSLNELNTAINTLDLGRGDNLETANNKIHFDNIVKTIGKLTECLEEIKNETKKLHKSLTKDKSEIKTIELIKNSIKSLNDLNTVINSLNLGRGNNLETLNNSNAFKNLSLSITNLTNFINEIDGKAKELKEKVKKLTGKDIKSIKNAVKTINEINKIINGIEGVETKKIIINPGTNRAKVAISDLNSTIIVIKDKLSALKNINLLANIKPIVDDFKAALKELDNIFESKPGDKLLGMVGVSKNPVADKLKAYLEEIENLSNLSKKIQTLGIAPWNVVSQGVNLMNQTMIQAGEYIEDYDNFTEEMQKIYEMSQGLIKPIQNLRAFNKELNNYVKYTNSLDVKKVNSITTLANALTNISKKFGNLDKMTKTLSTDLNVTLVKLIKALAQAEKTIKATDKIQADRKKNITEQIEKIKSIMGQELIVKVKQDESSSTGSSLSSSSVGGPDADEENNPAIAEPTTNGSPAPAAKPAPKSSKPTQSVKPEDAKQSGGNYGPQLQRIIALLSSMQN